MENNENIFETESYKDCSPYAKATIEFGHGMLKEMSLEGTDYDFDCGDYISAIFEQGRMIGKSYWEQMNDANFEVGKVYLDDPAKRVALCLSIASRWMWGPYFSLMTMKDSIEANTYDEEVSNIDADAAVGQLIAKLERLSKELGIDIKVNKVTVNKDIEEEEIKSENHMDFSKFDLDGYLKSLLDGEEKDA